MDNVEPVPAVPTEPSHAPEPAPPAPAAQSAEGDAGPVQTLPAGRVAELREQIRDGSYDAPEAADEVARRILAAGDV